MANTKHYIENLPLLKVVVTNWNKRKNKPLSKYKIFLIIHLLRDASAFMEAILELGGDPKKIFVIGKPYSTLTSSVKEINKLGFNNIWAPSDMDNFHKIIEKVLCKVVTKKSDVLILEDGGYCLEIIKKNKLDQKASIHGIVEQTTIGIWRDEAILKKFKINFPIINVAQSEAKTRLEPVIIGTAVRRNLENLITKIGKTCSGKTILVVGAGSIGNAVARSLKEENVVYVHDISPIKRIESRQQGLIVKPLKDALKEADIVIGCSGNFWAKKEQIMGMKNNAIFVCATSERIEYSHSALEGFSIKNPKIKQNFGIFFELSNGNKIILLAQGYPINFFGTNKESMPFESYQIISSLLLTGLLLLTTNLKEKSIIKFPENEQNILCENYELIRWST